MKTAARVLVFAGFLVFNIPPTQRSTGNLEESNEKVISVAFAPKVPEEDVRADPVLQTGHTKRVTVLAFSPAGNTLASGSEDKTVRLWEPKSGQQLQSLTGHTGSVRALAFSRDGRLLASGADDHTIRLWDILSGRLIATLEGHDEPVIAVSFSSDGKRLVSGGGLPGWEAMEGAEPVRLWDVTAKRLIRTLGNRVFGLNAVFFSLDGSRVSAANQEGDMEIWGTIATYDPESGNPFESRSEILRAFSPDSRILVLGTRTPFRPKKAMQGRGGIEFEPCDGQRGEIAAWEIGTGRRLFSVPAGH